METSGLKKKIAIISSSFPPLGAGGISSAHYNLYKALKDIGFIVKVFTFSDNRASSKQEEDVVRYGTPPVIVKVIRLLNNLFFKITDRYKIAYQFSDILQSALGSIRINFSLSRFRPDVLVLPDHGCPGFFIKKGRYYTILISHHNPARFLNNPLFGIHSEKDARMAIQTENRALKKVDRVICPSNYMKETFMKTYEFNGPIVVVPNVIDDRLISSIPVDDVRKHLGLREDAVMVYIPSAGSKYKGSSLVFEIIRRLSERCGEKIGFYLSGSISAELQHELSFVADSVKLFMPGTVSLHKNISIVKSCSFGVSPTLIESFGMAILEANFCRLPMVSFDVGGNADIVSNGENGFLVPYFDVNKLVYFAEKLLDKSFCDEMRTRTVNFVHDRFKTEIVVRKFLKFIDGEDH